MILSPGIPSLPFEYCDQSNGPEEDWNGLIGAEESLHGENLRERWPEVEG